MKKIGNKMAKIGPKSPKTKFELQNQYDCDISTDWKFYMEEEKIYFSGSKAKKRLSESKNVIWAQNQYGCVIYPSIGRFT
jgi:hypothetical protein